MEEFDAEVDLLCKLHPVTHRSTLLLKKREAFIRLAASGEALVLDIKGEPQLRLLIRAVVNLKAKEVVGTNGKLDAVLSFQDTSSPGFLQRSLQFSGKETRDLWLLGLKRLLAGIAAPKVSTAPRQKAARLARITKIVLVEPKMITDSYKLQVQCGGEGRSYVFSVQRTGALRHFIDNQLWSDVMTFLEASDVLPTEGVALYRYVKGVLERCLMEQSVILAMQEIDQAFVLKLHHAGHGMYEAYAAAEERLDALADRLPSEIGYLGLGAAIVEQILQRNIDKMRKLNEYVYNNPAGKVLELADSSRMLSMTTPGSLSPAWQGQD